MFEEFFHKYEIRDPEEITPAQSKKINEALQQKMTADNSQVKHSTEDKEKNIMKTKSIRTIIIAAAVAVVGLGGVVGASAMGDFLTSREIAAKLEEKNSPTNEYLEMIAEAEEISGREIHSSPWYSVMNVTEFAVRATTHADFKGWDEEMFPAIIFEHLDENGGFSQLITYDGNGGYLYQGEPITDELLLAAIAEGTEKYGDTFVIMY